MISFPVCARFAPSEFPNIWSSSPPRSNHASVLHGYPLRLGMVCPQTQSRHKLCSGSDRNSDKYWETRARLLLCCGDNSCDRHKGCTMFVCRRPLSCQEPLNFLDEPQAQITDVGKLQLSRGNG